MASTTYKLRNATGTRLGATRYLADTGTDGSTQAYVQIMSDDGYDQITGYINFQLAISNSSGTVVSSWFNYVGVPNGGVSARTVSVSVASDTAIPAGGALLFSLSISNGLPEEAGMGPFCTPAFTGGGTLKAGTHTLTIPSGYGMQDVLYQYGYYGGNATYVATDVEEAGADVTFAGALASESDGAPSGSARQAIGGALASESDDAYTGRWPVFAAGDVAADADSSPSGTASAIGVVVGGSAGAYYPVFTCGGVDFVYDTHDILLWVTDGTNSQSYTVTHDSYEWVDGDLVFTKAVATGQTVRTIVSPTSIRTFKVRHEFAFDADRRVRIQKKLGPTGGGGSHWSVPNYYFFAGGVSKSGVLCTLVPGNGWYNDWTPYGDTTVSSANRSMHPVGYASSGAAWLNYGQLANSSTTDYTCHVAAGVTKALEYAVGFTNTVTQRGFQQAAYVAYHDAFSTIPRSDELKIVWSTAHQLQVKRRHNHSDAAEYMWSVAAVKYSPKMYMWDMGMMLIGLGLPDLIEEGIRTQANCGPVTDSWYLPSNPMDASEPYYDFGMWAYAKAFLGVTPPAETYTWARQYAANLRGFIADKRMEMTHLGGDFEQGDSYEYAGPNTIWTLAAGATIPTGVSDGVGPHGGTRMLRLSGASSAEMIPICAGQGTTLDLSVWVNVVAGHTGNGIRLRTVEYAADKTTQVATSASSWVSSTSGWQQVTLQITTHTSGAFLHLIIESNGTGTAFADDLSCKESNPTTLKFWDWTWAYDVDYRDAIDVHSVSQLSLVNYAGAAKMLSAEDWTQDDEDALQEAISDYKTNLFADSNKRLRFSMYHPNRRTWVTTMNWAASLYHFLFSGGDKMFTDAEFTLIYNNYPRRSAGLPYGNVASPQICDWDGNEVDRSFAPANPFAGPVWYSTRLYEDGGGHLLAGYYGVSGAHENMLNRLRFETHYEYSTYDFLSLTPDEDGYAAIPNSVDGGQGFNVWIASRRPVLPATNVVAARLGADAIVSWTNNEPEAIGIYVERKIDAGAWEPVAVLGPTETAITDANVGQFYELSYRVAPYNATDTARWAASNVVYYTFAGQVADETDAGLLFGALTYGRSGVLCDDADTALSGTVRVAFSGQLASEADTALAGTSRQWFAGLLSTETDAASSGSARVAVRGATASDSDTAYGGVYSVMAVVPGSVASDTDSAPSGTSRLDRQVQGATASESDQANDGAVQGQPVTVYGDSAAESDLAFDGIARPALKFSGELAAEVESAFDGVTLLELVLFGLPGAESDDALAGSILSDVFFGGAIAEDADAALTGYGASLIVRPPFHFHNGYAEGPVLRPGSDGDTRMKLRGDEGPRISIGGE